MTASETVAISRNRKNFFTPSKVVPLLVRGGFYSLERVQAQTPKAMIQAKATIATARNPHKD